MPRAETAGRTRIGAACAIFDGERRILLVRHAYGRYNWELPGGAALERESPDATAARELLEETALALEDDGQLTGVYFEPAHDPGPMLHFVFRFDPPAALRPVAQPPEIDSVAWWSLDELPAPMSDFTERRIRDALAGAAVFAVIRSRAWR